MNNHTINTLQNTIHTGSLVVLGIVVIIVLVGVLKPGIFRILLRGFSQRKYILPACAFAGLLFGTVFFATQPQIDTTYVSENTKDKATTVDSLRSTDAALSQEIKTDDVEVIEPVEFTKEQREDAALPVGQTKLIQAGKNGLATRIYTVTSYESKETSRSLKSETVTVKPTPEITANGTKTDTTQADKKEKSKKKSDSDRSKPKKINLPRF